MLASKRLIFITSKLIKSNKIKFFLAPLHNWITRFGAGVTGSSRDASVGEWVLGGEIEIPCTYELYGRIFAKKLKGLNNCLIQCSFPYFIEI